MKTGILSQTLISLLLCVAGATHNVFAQTARPSQALVADAMVAALGSELPRVAMALSMIANEYVDPVSNRALLTVCAREMQHWSSANLQAVSPDPLFDTAPIMAENGVVVWLGRIAARYPQPQDQREISNACIRGMVGLLDPRSSYIDPKTFVELTSRPKPLTGVVGLEIVFDGKLRRVVHVIDNSPASKAGLQAGDVLLRIDDQAVDEMAPETVIAQLKGASGSAVQLSVAREGSGTPLQFNITRAPVEFHGVHGKVLAGHYLFLRISDFQNGALEDVVQVLRKGDQEASAGIKGIILDLRNNPGGSMALSIGVASVFLPSSSMVSAVKGRGNFKQVNFYARPEYYQHAGVADVLAEVPAYMRTLPLVVLVDHVTAAGSEVVASALQDNRRAIIVGRTSFGQGKTQIYKSLGRNAALKLTNARLIRPNGNTIDVAGVVPDVSVPLAAETSLRFGMPQDADLAQAIRVLQKK